MSGRVMRGSMRKELLVEDMPGGNPLEKMRAAVRWFDHSRMTERIDRIVDTPAKLLRVWSCANRCEFDIFADEMHDRQLREACRGIVPKFTEGPNGLVPVYEKRKR